MEKQLAFLGILSNKAAENPGFPQDSLVVEFLIIECSHLLIVNYY